MDRETRAKPKETPTASSIRWLEQQLDQMYLKGSKPQAARLKLKRGFKAVVSKKENKDVPVVRSRIDTHNPLSGQVGTMEVKRASFVNIAGGLFTMPCVPINKDPRLFAYVTANRLIGQSQRQFFAEARVRQAFHSFEYKVNGEVPFEFRSDVCTVKVLEKGHIPTCAMAPLNRLIKSRLFVDFVFDSFWLIQSLTFALGGTMSSIHQCSSPQKEYEQWESRELLKNRLAVFYVKIMEVTSQFKPAQRNVLMDSFPYLVAEAVVLGFHDHLPIHSKSFSFNFEQCCFEQLAYACNGVVPSLTVIRKYRKTLFPGDTPSLPIPDDKFVPFELFPKMNTLPFVRNYAIGKLAIGHEDMDDAGRTAILPVLGPDPHDPELKKIQRRKARRRITLDEATKLMEKEVSLTNKKIDVEADKKLMGDKSVDLVRKAILQGKDSVHHPFFILDTHQMSNIEIPKNVGAMYNLGKFQTKYQDGTGAALAALSGQKLTLKREPEFGMELDEDEQVKGRRNYDRLEIPAHIQFSDQAAAAMFPLDTTSTRLDMSTNSPLLSRFYILVSFSEDIDATLVKQDLELLASPVETRTVPVVNIEGVQPVDIGEVIRVVQEQKLGDSEQDDPDKEHVKKLTPCKDDPDKDIKKVSPGKDDKQKKAEDSPGKEAEEGNTLQPPRGQTMVDDVTLISSPAYPFSSSSPLPSGTVGESTRAKAGSTLGHYSITAEMQDDKDLREKLHPAPLRLPHLTVTRTLPLGRPTSPGTRDRLSRNDFDKKVSTAFHRYHKERSQTHKRLKRDIVSLRDECSRILSMDRVKRNEMTREIADQILYQGSRHKSEEVESNRIHAFVYQKKQEIKKSTDRFLKRQARQDELKTKEKEYAQMLIDRENQRKARKAAEDSLGHNVIKRNEEFHGTPRMIYARHVPMAHAQTTFKSKPRIVTQNQDKQPRVIRHVVQPSDYMEPQSASAKIGQHGHWNTAQSSFPSIQVNKPF